MTNFDCFNGVDTPFRTSGTAWPMPYRVRVYTNKNERQEYRNTVFCHTFDDAIKEALAQPEEANFCPRCGKRLASGFVEISIHTCTPPQGTP